MELKKVSTWSKIVGVLHTFLEELTAPPTLGAVSSALCTLYFLIFTWGFQKDVIKHYSYLSLGFSFFCFGQNLDCRIPVWVCNMAEKSGDW